MIDISLDLETLSSDARGASIAAIGMAARDFATGEQHLFHGYVDDPGGIISPETVRWHAAQQEPQYNLGGTMEAVPLGETLEYVGEFLRSLGSMTEGFVRIWSHATFDVPQLAAAYARVGSKVPWSYRNVRDLRTLYDLAGGRPKVEHAGKHHALSDAIAQLEEVHVCLASVGALGVTAFLCGEHARASAKASYATACAVCSAPATHLMVSQR